MARAPLYLHVLAVLCLEQALVLSLDAEGQVRTGHDVPPVAPERHSVASLIENPRGQQAGVAYLVDAFPQLKGQAALPPPDILMLVNDAALWIR